MASEFTRKVQKIKDILKFNSVLADDGDVLLTKDGEVYTQVNGKVKQLSNPNYGKDNANKILSVSDTGDAVPIPMPTSGDILGKDNTFTGNVSFIKPIDGSTLTKQIPVTDFRDIASDTIKYSGHWYVNAKMIDNSPLPGEVLYGGIEVIPGYNQYAGIILYSDFSSSRPFRTYITSFEGSDINWVNIDNDSNLVHNTGTETIAGDKTFNGQTTLLNGNFGLRVTNSGIVKTTDAGNTWTAL